MILRYFINTHLVKMNGGGEIGTKVQDRGAGRNKIKDVETDWKKMKEKGFDWNKSKVLDENETIYKPVG